MSHRNSATFLKKGAVNLNDSGPNYPPEKRSANSEARTRDL